MMRSQSCATAPGFEPIPISAGPIERAGLTDVPVMLMPDQMDDQRQADCQAAETLWRQRMGDAQDRHQEQERATTASR
jgi:hypothetical protein